MPSRGQEGVAAAERTSRSAARRLRRLLTLGALGTLAPLAAACSFTSLNGYFECPPANKNCKEPAPDGGGGTVGGSAGDGAAAGIGGTGGVDGGDTGSGGLGGQAGSPGAGPGDPCMSSADCAAGTCFHLVCGDDFELSYADTPDSGSDPTQAKWIKFQFQIKNRTAKSYPLSAFTLRYYYTPDQAASQFQALATSAPPDNVSKVTGTFNQFNGWTYLEVGFTANAGTVNASGGTSGVVKVGIHDKNFTDLVFFEPDDYSYLNVAHVTLYLNSALVSGIEPAAPPKT